MAASGDADFGKARMLFDFAPGGEGQLSARAGEVVELRSAEEQGGWWLCGRGTEVGWLPTSYLETL